jgi:hypothetical protein
VALIDHIQNQKSKNDLEMVAVRGVAIAQGEVVAPGVAIEENNQTN